MESRIERTAIVCLAIITLGGCGSDDDEGGLPTEAPSSVEPLASEGFENAGAAASSPDGQTFYVAAYTPERQPAIFTASADAGVVAPLHVGAPLSYPTDLAVTCDGSSILVGDMGLSATPADNETAMIGLEDLDEPPPLDAPAIHRLAAAGGIEPFTAAGIARATGLVVNVECDTLYVSGFTDEGEPAVFTVPVEGGTASVLYQGAPLRSPTGIHVDADAVAWVMDHAAEGQDGDGLLFAIDANGTISEVVSGLGMGRHGGVSLVPGGVTAVIPVTDEFDGPRLITANTQTGDASTILTPDIPNPTGVASARDASVMVVTGESSINIARFE